MKIRLTLLFLLSVFAFRTQAQTAYPFANEVKEFQKKDSLNFPKPGGILFIGSSSIRLWDDLEQRFAGKPIIKRGLGGTEIWQWVQYYMPHVAYPYKPKKVFIYAGENDIASGRSPEEVAGNFEKLWNMIHTNLPKAKIYYLSIKASPSRMRVVNQVGEANKLIKASIKVKPGTKYIDVNTVFQGENTTVPDTSLFKKDMLHLNSKGYDRWQKAIEKYVK
jgi:hypothetical protein